MARSTRSGVGRLIRSKDFERVLRAAPRGTSAHFAIHHVGAMPSRPGGHRERPVDQEISTTDAPIWPETVDDSSDPMPFVGSGSGSGSGFGAGSGIWLGVVVPKRHARRSVTRNLLRREIRAAVIARRASLPDGLWVVRLRAGFDRSRFPSAASKALRQAAREELASLVDHCAATSLARAKVRRGESV